MLDLEPLDNQVSRVYTNAYLLLVGGIVALRQAVKEKKGGEQRINYNQDH
jgi:hypothetical protein